jgi:hypothetical protein
MGDSKWNWLERSLYCLEWNENGLWLLASNIAWRNHDTDSIWSYHSHDRCDWESEIEAAPRFWHEYLHNFLTHSSTFHTFESDTTVGRLASPLHSSPRFRVRRPMRTPYRTTPEDGTERTCKARMAKPIWNVSLSSIDRRVGRRQIPTRHHFEWDSQVGWLAGVDRKR